MAVAQASNVGPLLQGGTVAATPSLGATAAAPAVAAPKTTLTPAQTAPAAPSTNLSGTYANVNGTIYNKSTGQAYSTPAQFFAASGQTGFGGLTFDTTWKPATPAPVASAAPASTGSLSGIINPVGSNNAPLNASQPATPAPAAATTPPVTGAAPLTNPTQPYTPPNNGTTGVSLGGTIGDLINSAQPSASYQAAQASLTAINQQIQQLQNQYAQEYPQMSQNGNTTLALGDQAVIQQTYNGKLAALTQQAQEQSNILAAATGQQQAEQNALTSAGNLNPNLVTTPGQSITSASAPPGNATSAGTQSLSQLVTTTPSPSNSSVTQYGVPMNSTVAGYTPGQQFSTPAQLATYLNLAAPGTNATASNVFSLLAQPQGSSIVGGNSALNPISQISSLASQVVGGTMSYTDALNAGGSTPGFASALQAAITSQNPGFNFNTAQGSASAQQSNAQVGGTAAVTAGQQAYIQSYPAVQQLNQALNNITTLGNMTVQNAAGNNVNPFSLAPANATLAQVKTLLSNAGQVTFNSNMAALQGAIEALYAASGGSTPTNITNQINAMADGSLSVSGLQSLLAAAQQEGAGKLANAQATASAEYAQSQGGTGNGGTPGTASAGGYTYTQNAQGQWVVSGS